MRTSGVGNNGAELGTIVDRINSRRNRVGRSSRTRDEGEIGAAVIAAVPLNVLRSARGHDGEARGAAFGHRDVGRAIRDGHAGQIAGSDPQREIINGVGGVRNTIAVVVHEQQEE